MPIENDLMLWYALTHSRLFGSIAIEKAKGYELLTVFEAKRDFRYVLHIKRQNRLCIAATKFMNDSRTYCGEYNYSFCQDSKQIVYVRWSTQCDCEWGMAAKILTAICRKPDARNLLYVGSKTYTTKEELRMKFMTVNICVRTYSEEENETRGACSRALDGQRILDVGEQRPTDK